MNKGRAREEQGMSKHVLSQLCCINMNCIVSTMRQLSFVCEIMQLAAFPLRNQRDLRETWPFTCKGRTRKEQGKNEHVSSQLCCINMNCIVCTMWQLSFVCEIMQLAAFLCVISVICGRNGRSHVRSEQGKNEGILSQLYCINMNCMTLL